MDCLNDHTLCFSILQQITDPKGRNITQSVPTKKKKDHGEKVVNNASDYTDTDSSSIFSSRALDREEFVSLKEQVEDLQRKLLEKDELLKSAENSRNQVNTLNEKFNELKSQASEKDSLLKSTQQQLSDVKVPFCLCYFIYNLA